MNDALDIDWLAQQYVLDELGPAESAEFVDRLNHDSSAREAVTRAIELVGGVAALVADKGPARASVELQAESRSVRVHIAWIAGPALAACLVVGIGLQFSQQVEFKRKPRAHLASPAAGDLALAWRASRGLAQTEVPEVDLSDPPLLFLSGETGDIPLTDAEEFPLPNWLMAAASLSQKSPPADSPEVPR